MFLFPYFVLLFATVSFACNCTSKLDPICASDGKVYKNGCEFDCANINNNTITKKPRFYCLERCPVPLIFAPVCGTNRKTYANRYVADCDRLAYPEISLEYEEAVKVTNDTYLPEYEMCKNDCVCPRRTSGGTVCSSSGEVFRDGCDFYCAKHYWYKELKLEEVDLEFCGVLRYFVMEIEKYLIP